MRQIAAHRTARLAVIGTLAGLFSGIFGVGGGTVIVPLLMLWLGFSQSEATGTSLAAIVFIAGFSVVVQGLYGNVHLLDGMLIGLPAMAGVAVGTWLHQRLNTRHLTLLFSLVLIAAAVELLV